MSENSESHQDLSAQNKKDIFIVELRENFQKSLLNSPFELNQKLLMTAFNFALKAHHNQFRKSGTPYIVHPIEVSNILIDLNMDSETIVAGLLHDVVEDCNVSLEEIKKIFGKKVSFLVDSVTKISVIQEKASLERQAGTYRKMMISIAEDFRVVMIKFADRLHNMRTLYFLSEEKRKNISKETLDFYAPLANRFGLYQIRRELEDLSFKNLYYQEYTTLSKQFSLSEAERQQHIKDTINKLQEIFKENKFSAEVFGRTKNLYGIYQKMKIKKCKFENLYDVFALRVIVNNLQDCYLSLGFIHQIFVPLMTRFKDYISLPKANMYQSLHTVVIGLKGLPVEFQIRTKKMNLIAEQGVAAHWSYKGKQQNSPKCHQVEAKWLKDFMQWQENLNDSAEFVDFLHLDVKREQELFVFTPKGDLFHLCNGSTALDFAFAVHTEVGKNCIGAKIDGIMVPFSTVLQTGNTVDILTSKEQNPLQSWLRMVCTSKARVTIRKYLKEESIRKHVRIGSRILRKEFMLYKMNKEDFLSKFMQKFQVSNWDDLYCKVSQGQIVFKEVTKLIKTTQKNKELSFWRFWFTRIFKSRRNFIITISGQDDDWLKAASCCKPIHGDKIIGYIIDNRDGIIHRFNCQAAINLHKRDNVHKISVRWDKSTKNKVFQVSVELIAVDRYGLLENISAIFSHHQVNIDRASIITTENQIRDRFRISVASLDSLEDSLEKIRGVKGVKSIMRIDEKMNMKL